MTRISGRPSGVIDSLSRPQGRGLGPQEGRVAARGLEVGEVGRYVRERARGRRGEESERRRQVARDRRTDLRAQGLERPGGRTGGAQIDLVVDPSVDPSHEKSERGTLWP